MSNRIAYRAGRPPTVLSPGGKFEKSVGLRIREARLECGLSQIDMAKVMSRPISHAAFSDIERAKRRVTLGLLYEIAVLLGKPPAWFLEGFEGERKNDATRWNKTLL